LSAMNDESAVDPVTTEIIRNAFFAAAEDMKAALVRSAFSPVIYEAKDCSVALFNENVEMLGQAPGLPFFLGGLDASIKATLDKYGPEQLNPGDVIIVNDAYITGSHLNDVDILAPVIFDNQLVGFVASRAHWRDVGSKDAAYTTDATEIYQEGFRLAPTKVVNYGNYVDDVVDFISLNGRLPKMLNGDMNAQIAACRMGEKRFTSLLERFGLDTVKKAMQQVFETTEKLERDYLSSIPDGVYEEEGLVDNDYQTDEPFPVKVKVVINGSDITVDTYGSSKQRPGSTNCGYPQAVSAIRLAYNFLINSKTGLSGGSFRPLKAKIETGSIFAAEEPAACMQYGVHTMLLVDLIIKALSPVIPKNVAAGLPGDAWNVIFIIRNPNENNKVTVSGESTAGGWGANAFNDGANGVIHLAAADYRNMPVESLENKHPIKVLSYSLGKDSGGPGQYRGGLGIVREYELLNDAWLCLWFERTKTPQWGLFGGKHGRVPDVTVSLPNSQPIKMLKVNHKRLPPGTRVSVSTGGGGGYGLPHERELSKVKNDVVNGYVSIDAAATEYGVYFQRGTLDLDYERTAKGRNQVSVINDNLSRK